VINGERIDESGNQIYAVNNWMCIDD